MNLHINHAFQASVGGCNKFLLPNHLDSMFFKAVNSTLELASEESPTWHNGYHGFNQRDGFPYYTVSSPKAICVKIGTDCLVSTSQPVNATATISPSCIH